jgi:uncharacterized membrane protein YuzA (DUF378 family)
MHKHRALVWLEIFSLFFLVIGALNWGLVGVARFNAVEWLAKRTFAPLATMVYVVVGLSALLHLFSRDYYLRFLGDAAFPCGSLVERAPEGADTEVRIQVAPESSVIFWASEPHQTTQADPWIAYKEFANAGVAKADASGVARLKVRRPAPYKVGVFGKELRPHVHYRECSRGGIARSVKTVFLDTPRGETSS